MSKQIAFSEEEYKAILDKLERAGDALFDASEVFEGLFSGMFVSDSWEGCIYDKKRMYKGAPQYRELTIEELKEEAFHLFTDYYSILRPIILATSRQLKHDYDDFSDLIEDAYDRRYDADETAGGTQDE